MIKLQNITKIFEVGGEPLTVLDDISLDIEQGQIFGVIGASGAGKSTLIRCVNLLERPTQGQVIVDNQNLTALDDKQLIAQRKKIGMIFQHFNLLSSRTAAENIALALELSHIDKEQIQQRVDELLDLVGLSERRDSYPANLSGGQKQRVAIARALATNPKVLLCDEATSALDPATTKSILELLKEINQRLGITILLITHEMSVVKQICHQVAVLDQGKLIEQGKVRDIFANPKTALVQEFIQSTLHNEMPESYLNTLSPEMKTLNSRAVFRLTFTGKSSDEPILSQLTKQYKIDFNILSSELDYVEGVKFGFMVAELAGTKTAIELAKQAFIENHIDYEVLGYVD